MATKSISIITEHASSTLPTWGIKKWEEVSKTCMALALAIITASAVCAGFCLSLESSAIIMGVGFIIGLLGFVKCPPYMHKLENLLNQGDDILSKAENFGQVPERLAIAGKVLLPNEPTIGSAFDGLSTYTGMIGILRTVPLAVKVVQGKTLEGDAQEVLSATLLTTGRALCLTSFLHRIKAIHLPKGHSEGIGIGIFVSFIALNILSFISSLRTWLNASTEESYAERYTHFGKEYDQMFAKDKQDLRSAWIHSQVISEITKKGNDAGSDFLEAVFSPLDTGAISHSANPYLVVPLAILGAASAAIRLWRGYDSDKEPRADLDRLNVPSSKNPIIPQPQPRLALVN